MAEDEIKPRTAFEEMVIRWLSREYRIKFEADAKNAMYVVSKQSLKLTKDGGGDETIHEATHAWFHLKKKVQTTMIGIADLDFAVKEDHETLNLLNGGYMAVLLTEQKMSDEGRGIMTKRIGEAETRNFLFGGKRQDWVGNLVDETATLNKERSVGHPGDNVDEFFASFMTTMTYDGEVFFRNLDNLKKAGKESREAATIYTGTTAMLRACQALGMEMFNEMKKFANGDAFKLLELGRMEMNLRKLDIFLLAEEKVQGGKKQTT